MSAPQIFLISSLEKILPAKVCTPNVLDSLSLLKNEAASFQVLVQVNTPEDYGDIYGVVRLVSPLSDRLTVSRVRAVPSLYPAPLDSDDDYLTKTPGLLPDALMPDDGMPFRLQPNAVYTFWVDIPAGLSAGQYPLRAELTTRSGHLIASAEMTLRVIDAQLPPLPIRHTEWFHCDCLCDTYGVEMFSDAFFEIAERYVRCAAEHGINMLLTPVFTPSLDVEEGESRRPAQLVGVTIENETYHFDFALLDRWVNTFSRCGIRYFEIAHFFTQWGAKHAIRIAARKDGKDVTLFGWDTPSDSPRYADFLKTFLPQLVQHLKQLGVKAYFHISDEPSLEHIDAYRRAKEMVEPYLGGFPVIDALSDYAFYQEGLVPQPVVACNHIQPFIQNDVPHLWTYYCCVQGQKVPNRFMAMPSSRNRVLGVLLYLYKLEGFLQWGFNYWYTQLSKKLIDPFSVTDAGQGFPSGDAFLVYPGKDGSPIPSIRLNVLRDAMDDLRALTLLEQLEGRKAVCLLIEKYCGKMNFDDYPRKAQPLLDLREAVNQAVEQAIQKEIL